MEVIIQLIIFLIIIFSIVKRLKEISEKPKDLEKTEIPDQVFDMVDAGKIRGEPEEKPLAFPPQPESAAFPVTVEEAEPVPAMIEEPVAPELLSPEPAFKEPMVMEPELPQPPGESIPGITEHHQPVTSGKVLIKHAEPLVPGFNASQVTRGIIMSEILGLPVSMRGSSGF